MEININGSAKEIAALVLAVQERQGSADIIAGQIAKELERIAQCGPFHTRESLG